MIILTSCSDNITYNEDAIKLTVSDIVNTPTNSWFRTEMIMYKPDTNITKQIISNFDANKHKFYMYANFSCGCNDQQTDIAHICKILSECNIPDSSYEIYSMRSKTSVHPYKLLFSISDLPESIIMKDTSAVYFMFDTLRYYKLFGQTIPVEKLILDGLKK